MSLAPRSSSRRISLAPRHAVTVAPSLFAALVVGVSVGIGCGSSDDFTTAAGVDASVGDGSAASNGGGGSGGSDGGNGIVVVAPPPTGGQMDGGDASTVPPIVVMDAGSLSTDDCNQKADISQLFVSPSGTGNAGPNGCTSTTPCPTIAAALASVNATRTTVYIDKGMYTEQIVLAAGVSLRGGWQDLANGWSPICDPSRLTSVVVTAPTTTNKTVVATNLGGTAAIADLEILSKSAAAPSESIYGIFATGTTTTLLLDEVSVAVAAGGNGTNGTAGSAGDPTVCANGGPGNAEGDGTAGLDGTNGNGATTTHYDQNGLETVGATNGGTANGGNQGQGSDGPTCITLSLTNVPHRDASCVAGTDPGQGCPCITGGSMQSCAAGGARGCGGAPGTPGTAGTNGGSSIALYAYQANVTVMGSTLAAGNGGNGGNGGAGGAGAPPQDNYAAGKGPGTPKDCRNSGAGQNEVCLCAGTNDDGAVGVAGTKGGAGGTGGTGGGGSGGDSYAIYASGGAIVMAPSAGKNPGIAGTAGTGAGTAGNGAPGQSAMTN